MDIPECERFAVTSQRLAHDLQTGLARFPAENTSHGRFGWSMRSLGRSVSGPHVTAIDALRGVHTLQPAACRARPALLF